MCGITGVIVFNNEEKSLIKKIPNALVKLSQRGPDFQKHVSLSENISFGHARLSIIDVSNAANQPMSAFDNRYTIVFNGEIFNYLDIKKELIELGETFETSSDTEVLLKSYHYFGKDCVLKLNGFYAFAIYDKKEEITFLARDRMGIKPLLYRKTENSFLFASEMKAIMGYEFEKKIDFNSLHEYFQYNYIPYPNTIFEDVKKLEPGHYLLIDKNGKFEKTSFYNIPKPEKKNYKKITYEQAQSELKTLLEESVKRRLVADVPLGTFLSGGIDSSVITAIASKHIPDLNTFSVGFADNPYFDETAYAQLVAKKYKTNHTVFSLTNKDLFDNLNAILDYIDEPFADSSAIPVYILSKMTRKKVTVSLSGDGADEMFGGYNKHFAEYKTRQKSLVNESVSALQPLWKMMPKSRNSKFSNLFRQLDRFAEGYKLNDADRYRRWCAFSSLDYSKSLLKTNPDFKILDQRKDLVNSFFTPNGDLNESLYADMHQVLVNDMLTKVDSMSMANSLEVRTPFLDYNVVNFAFAIPPEFKVNKNGRKTILKDAFRNELPKELYTRNKMGFEIPLLQWFQTDLKSLIFDDLLSEKYIKDQNIFNIDAINALKAKLFSKNPEEVHAQIWALIVFQTWWKKYMN